MSYLLIQLHGQVHDTEYFEEFGDLRYTGSQLNRVDYPIKPMCPGRRSTGAELRWIGFEIANQLV